MKDDVGHRAGREQRMHAESGPEVRVLSERSSPDVDMTFGPEDYRVFFEHNPSPMILYDEADLRIVRVNEAAVARYGYTHEEFVALTIADIRPPEDVPKLRARLEAGPGTHTAGETWRHRAKGGEIFHVEISSRRIPYRDRSLRLALVRDVTVQIRAGELLLHQRDLLAGIAAGRPVDEVLEALCQFVEGQAAQIHVSVLLKDPAEELLRFGVAPSLPPSYAEIMQRVPIGPSCGSCGTAAFRREPVHVVDIANDPRWSPWRDAVLAHGLRACWSTPVLAENGDVLGTLAIYARASREPSAWECRLIDVATHVAGIALGRQRTLEKRQASEHLLRRLAMVASRTTNGVVITDREGRIQWVNEGFTRITGYAPDELEGRKPGAVLQGLLTNPETIDEMRRCVRAGEAFRVEVVNYRKDGTPYWILVDAEPLRDEGGVLTGFMAIETDITERKRNEQELVHAKERAEELARLKASFLANMSHEIRTPLTFIIGFSEMLREMYDGEGREMIEMIHAGAERLLETLNSVLDLAQLESGSLVLHADAIDLGESVAAAVLLAGQAAAKKGLALDVAEPAERVRARADRGALGRVLNNLVSNAIKFTEGGSIRVTYGVDPAHEGREVFLRVDDTGIGIDASFLPYLFEEFRQESSGRSRTHEGSGLGLTITKRLVELMAGTIEVESEKGEGSSFTVRLPRALDVSPVPVRAEAPPVRTNGRPRLLVVEDQEEAQVLIRLLLRNAFEVVSAYTAEQALERAEEGGFEGALVDINLGGELTGLDVLRGLRAKPGGASMPVVVCTAYVLPGDRERFLEAGFDGYVGKPYRKRELLEALTSALATA